MKQYLAVTLLAEDKPSILLELAELVAQYQCSIETCRIVKLATKMSYALSIAGTWDALHKFEAKLTQFAKKENFEVNLNRASKPAPRPNKVLTYNIELVTTARANIISEIAKFLAKERIEVEELTSNTYHSHTGTLMSQLIVRILIPADTPLIDLRERFMTLCETLNIDAALEPDRS